MAKVKVEILHNDYSHNGKKVAAGVTEVEESLAENLVSRGIAKHPEKEEKKSK